MRRIQLSWLLGGLLGCGKTTADVATLSLDDADVSIDSRCPDESCQDDAPVLSISIPEDITVGSSASLELVQYRVDYSLPDITGGDAVPFFAEALSAETIAFSETLDVDLTAAGDKQRDYVYDLVGGDVTSGTATLTLLAYDEVDALVELSLEFDVTFADYTATTDTEGK